MMPGEATLRRLGRQVLILGEGAATGLFAGGVLGGWEVWLNADLAHAMPRLLAHHLVPPMLECGALGLALSAVIAFLMGGLARRGRRAVGAGILGLALLWIGGLAALAYPLREWSFPLHRYSAKGVTDLCFGLIAAACLLLLARRSQAALRCSRQFHQKPSGRSHGGMLLLKALHLTGAGVAVAATVLGLLLVGFRPAGAGAAGRPSIILVSIDTLRADRLRSLGNARALTPALDRLAAEGIYFEQAISAAPWTLPSHASLFTSLLPFDMRRHWDYGGTVHLARVLLAERLYEAGYRTAGFTGGGYVSSQFGFEQGFEVYEDHDETLEGGPEAIAEAALSWVRSVKGAPFFLFLHTYEPHYPYVHADFAKADDAGRLPRIVSGKEVEEMHRGRLVPTPAERRYVTDLYDGDVAHADSVIGGFLEALRGDGTLDRTLVVVLSDHGEELWDREPGYSPDHGHSLYQELVHVPLLFRWPGQVRAGARIRTPVSLLDVVPTLLDLAGLPADPLHEGRSLATTLRTGGEPDPRTILVESVQYGPDRFLMRTGDLAAILTPYPDRLDNAVSIPARALEVFDLAVDPLEQHDLSSHLTGTAAEMVDALWQRSRGILNSPSRKGAEEAPELPEELLEQLRSLGYLR